MWLEYREIAEEVPLSLTNGFVHFMEYSSYDHCVSHRVLLEKLIVASLFKLPDFYGTKHSLSCFQESSPGMYAKREKYSPVYLFKKYICNSLSFAPISSK
jgi:hypothetical protein